MEATFMAVGRQHAANAALHIRRISELNGELRGTSGPNGQVGLRTRLADWEAIMLPCFVGLLCLANILTAAIEIYIQQPIWQCLDPTKPYIGWGGAVAMVLIGMYISNLFAKTFVGELQDWWVYLRRSRTDRVDPEAARQACQQDTRRDLLLGLLFLLPTLWWTYHLTWKRVTLEAAAKGVTPEFTVLDWLPTAVFLLNATVLGVYWEYVYKRAQLKRTIGQREAALIAETAAAKSEAQRTADAYRDALAAQEPDALHPPKEVRDVLDWHNRASGTTGNTGFIETGENECIFALYDGPLPLPNEPLLVYLDDDTQLPLLRTDSSGLVFVRWAGAQLALNRIRLVQREAFVPGGPWQPGTFNRIDISSQPSRAAVLSLN